MFLFKAHQWYSSVVLKEFQDKYTNSYQFHSTTRSHTHSKLRRHNGEAMKVCYIAEKPPSSAGTAVEDVHR